MKSNPIVQAAALLSAIAIAVAQEEPTACASILVPTYSPPSVAPGWQAQLVLTGLTKPRTIVFDEAGGLLVLEAGKGVSRHKFTDNEGTCLILEESKLLIEAQALNHGLALSENGRTVYASSSESVFAWTYDERSQTVSGSPRVLVDGMSNNDLVTRTILVSKHQPDTILVSRGSAEENMAEAEDVDSGLSQIRAFDLSNMTSSSEPFDFNTEGEVIAWGLRNSVGMAEHPVTGGIFAVENSVDGVTRNGKDIHENNPGEELNFLGFLNGTSGDDDGANGNRVSRNYGYPHCFAVWDIGEIPDNDGLAPGDQFARDESGSMSDDVCLEDYIPPRLTFPAHYAPMDILFTEEGDEAFVTFRGSFDKTDPVGYRLSSIAWDPSTGEPKHGQHDHDSLRDIISNKDNSVCPDNCFRPVGLALDSAGRIWMTSDSTGEVYVLQRTGAGSGTGEDGEEAPSSTESGTIVQPTKDSGACSARGSGCGWERGGMMAGWAVAVLVGAGWFAVF